MLTERENCRRAIEFKSPERLPMLIGVLLGWIYEKDQKKIDKIHELQKQMKNAAIIVPGCWIDGENTGTENVRQWKDEWGTGWEDDGHGGKTESYPMESGYEFINSATFPDPERAGRFNEADKWLDDNKDLYRICTVWFTLFERLWMLRGFENMLTDPYTDLKNFYMLRDKVLEVNLGMIDKWVKRDVDAIYFSDDWGSQRGLLINPDDWRKFYKPAYKMMFDKAHDSDKHVWMHLCGDISAILPDLVDIGLDVLNPVQPQAMDVCQLSKDFGGKLCFNGGVDVQGTLIRGSADDVKREVDNLVHLFGRFNGGFIAGTSHSVMPETPLDNVIALYEAFLAYA